MDMEMSEPTLSQALRGQSPTEQAAPAEPVRVERDCPAPPVNTGDSPRFGALASLFSRMSKERHQDRRKKALDTWFEQWRKTVGNDLYPVFRLLLPERDRERVVYGIKEKNLARLYIKLIPLEQKSPDATRLLNWKRPTERHQSSGDFSAVLAEVIGKRSSVLEGSLTVKDVNTILDELAQSNGKQDVQMDIMKTVYARATPEEQRWIARIILRDVGIFVKETTIFSVFHPDAHDLFNTCTDLKRVAWELWDPNYRLNKDDKSVQLFRAFAPMLCKRPARHLEDSVKDMGGRTFIIEEKLDGERIQLHKRGNEYFYSSRKAKDYTYLYGKHIGEGTLTPHIADCFDPRVEECVLDGELLVWDPVSERHLPFGTLKTAAVNTSATLKDPRPCFKIFDMLYLNGQSLIHMSLKFRKRNMKAYVREKPGHMEYIKESTGKTANDIRAKMEEIMEDRGEGLVIKHPASEYVLNGRNKDWIKCKPEYMDNMGETVDVLVVAGSYGKGKRSGGVSSLICAVRDDRTVGDSQTQTYSTFVRVGTGFSLSDYVWIRDKPWKKRTSTQNSAAVQTSPEKAGPEDKGDLYLEPEDSFIISIKAAEIIPSDQYHLKYTLRFPRALRTREDLTVADCMTASALIALVRDGKKRKTSEEEVQQGKKKRKLGPTKKAQPTLLGTLKGQSIKDVQVETDIFEDMTFTVSADPSSKTGDADRSELLKLIKANGGKFYQIAKNQPGLLVIYGGATTPYDIKMIMNKGVHDIIRPQWILDCIAAQERLPLKKKHFFHATAKRKQALEDSAESGDPDGSDTESEAEEDASELSPAPETFMSGPGDTQLLDEDEDTSINQAYSDWFHVGEGRASPTFAGEENRASDTESELDRDEGEEWVQVDDLRGDTTKLMSQLDVDDEKISEAGDVAAEEEVTMGDGDGARNYDENRIFTHLRFYLDTPGNARKNGMDASSKHESAIEQSLADIKTLISDNGGRVTEQLDDSKLTHIVLDKRNTTRRRELMQRTSRPKRRYLVVSDFVDACLEENTLLDEMGKSKSLVAGLHMLYFAP